MKNISVRFAAVAFGLAGFLIAFSLGTVLTAGTGIPLLGGLLNGVLVSMVLAIGLVAIGRFGTGMTMWLVLSVCAIPTTTLGPPGVYKVVLGVAAGLIWDIIFIGMRRTRSGLFIGALAASLFIMMLLLGALRLGFGKDAEAALARYMGAVYLLIVLNLVVTAFGVFWGELVYRKRLRHLRVFQNLRHVQDEKPNEL